MTPLFDLYIACCTPKGGIVHAVLFDDGTLQEAERLSAPSPLYLALSGDRLHTLLCDPFETGESGHAVAALSPEGALSALGRPTPTGGGEACFVSLCDGAAFIANYQTGSVARVDASDSLRLHKRDGRGTDDTRQEAPHPHCILPSPDGRFLLCADLGTDTITTYDRTLTPLCSAAAPAGSGARHLAFSADGRFVYCVGELDNTVTVFSYESGRLTALKTVNALPDFFGESYAAALRVREGRLYVSHRGADCVTVFSANGADLEFEQSISCGGKWPRDMERFGAFLVCTNEKSDTVTVLRRAGDGWEVSSLLSLPRPLCVVGRPRR